MWTIAQYNPSLEESDPQSVSINWPKEFSRRKKRKQVHRLLLYIKGLNGCRVLLKLTAIASVPGRKWFLLRDVLSEIINWRSCFTMHPPRISPWRQTSSCKDILRSYGMHLEPLLRNKKLYCLIEMLKWWDFYTDFHVRRTVLEKYLRPCSYSSAH